MYSPIRNASSAMKKMPDTMSRTRDWEPKLMARPKMDAPAISDVVLTPRLDSAIKPASSAIVIRMKTRIRGSTVCKRVAIGAGSSLGTAGIADGMCRSVCMKTIRQSA